MLKENAAKPVDIQICPQCMGSWIRRVCLMEGDMSGIIVILPVNY
jgi:Zn-finger nucleic acid-binding protein